MLESALIAKMSTAERLAAMEQLWEALADTPEAVQSPPWHGQVLAQRRARAERGESRFLTLNQLRAHLGDSTR